MLALLYAHFRATHLAVEDGRAVEFRAFCARGGKALLHHALFEALDEHFFPANGSRCGWPAWPDEFRDPHSDAVARFAAAHVEHVEYYQWLQWQAALQLDAVARQTQPPTLSIGVYGDLAVSIDRAGAEAWANQRIYAVGASVGAPPDLFNMLGQDWGLSPPVPGRLREAAYAPFIATLRANMHHAGALRIDHVMGLMRLFWVPRGAGPADGAYVHYSLADLLGIVALESQRHRCLVIGEDLGTVPEDLRGALSQAGVLSYRLLLFERLPSDEFKPPAAYPTQALVAVSTHDLPTLAGWWQGRDLDVRAELDLFPDEAARLQQIADRAQDRARLLRALDRERLLPPGVGTDPAALPTMTAAVAHAVHAFLAQTPAQLLVVQLEDVIGVNEQANMPATVDTHPNWRRKLPLVLEHWPDDSRFLDLVRILLQQRPVARSSHRGAARNPTQTTARVPRATYRLQLHRDFNFAQATELVPYLAALGVSHIYCSPYLRARAGSRHGYDIVDHAAFNPEIGGPEEFERFAAELERHGMGQIADVVPNHVAIMGDDNAWWMDVLENGEASPFADYFDIDWHPIDPDLAGKVLVPVLGDHYGSELERGALRVAYDNAAGAFAIRYHEHRLPIDPRDYAQLLASALETAAGMLASEVRADVRDLIDAFANLPPRAASARAATRQRDNAALKARLARLTVDQPALADAIDRALQQINGAPGEPRSFDTLHALLETQAYRVAFWRVASDEINYRRFFDVNDLAALRMEDDAVFEATHRHLLGLAASDKIDGLRIDHPDGLYDPAAYFQRLQDGYLRLAGHGGAAQDRPLYVVAEKIQAPHEQLPASWPIHGTTGYRFASLLNGVFVDTAARMRTDRTWRAFVGEQATSFDDAAYLGRRAIMRSALSAELSVLANRLLRIARADRRTRDLTLSSLRQALVEIAACFPVYRTYVAQRVSAQDRRYIEWALAKARRRSRTADASVFSFISGVLLLQPPEGASATLIDDYRAFTMRFQQFTAPVTAKGIEDTAFYIFNRLVSLNEVGSDPAQFGTTRRAFHRANAERLARWPDTLLAASTHDNKRAADVRARIDVISEIPAAWRLLGRRWTRMNRWRKRVVDDRPTPSRNDEYLLYQTLIGTFPVGAPADLDLHDYRERIEQYMVKAAREAKVDTSWISVDAEYESALKAFVAALLEDNAANVFLSDLRTNAALFAWFGALNSAAMALLHCTSPGVPDIYQGTELLDLSLVDPDNRRPVDYARRRDMLHAQEELAAAPLQLRANELRAMLEAPHDGRLKFWVLWRALRLRRNHPELFARGDYLPAAIMGGRARHVLAFARRHGNAGVVVLCGRLFASLGLPPGAAPVGAAVWRDTTVELPFVPAHARLTNLLTGEVIDAPRSSVAIAAAFDLLPLALLAYGDPPPLDA